ncbi:MAG TPA: polysaccharide deacetylase family protein [Candidatus Sulfotelmatobacter sp.]|nr:polysaccharide deacetylase family protein [Candidatus Sulfotelmatobacter sp.]
MVYPTLSAIGYLRPRSGEGQLAIVTYHGVVPVSYAQRDSALDGNLVSADRLRAQLRLLKDRYSVISPETFLSWLRNQERLPPYSVLLTCDDGLRNVLTDMLPVLLDEGVRCLFFVTGASASESRTMLWYEDLFLLFLRAPAGNFEVSYGGVSIQAELRSVEQRRAAWWNSVKQLSRLDPDSRTSLVRFARGQFGLTERDLDREGPACRRFGLLTATELRELASAGMTIGAHTLSHPVLSQASPETAFAEISGSKSRLESVLNTMVWAFAYPFGDKESVTPQILAMPRRAGFEAAFMNEAGGFGAATSPFALARVHVTAEMRLPEFEASVSGFHERLRRASRGASFGLRRG